MPEGTGHPAQFSPEIIDVLRRMIQPYDYVYDPFAGTGLRLGALCDEVGATFLGGDIEDWPGHDHRVRVADALDSNTYPQNGLWVGVPWMIVTSPCLAQSQRVLTSDLRWVPVGDVEVGDTLMAFDVAPSSSGGPRRERRKWRRATVVRSIPRSVECLRVVLANGDEIVTTPEHPWLVVGEGRSDLEWRASRDLLGISAKGYHRAGQRPRASVLRQTDTWSTRDSFDAGWLSGMFDGEGHISLGSAGAPKLVLTQALGSVLDRAETLMASFGYEPYRCVHVRSGGEGRQKVAGLYVPGGFPGLMRVLGELRPTRLLDKWETFDLSSRSIQASPVRVLNVERAGVHEIQEIETSAGTYIGEGYLMHNCYQNKRLGDYCNGPTPTTKVKGRRDYGIGLGRALHSNNLARVTGRPKKEADYWRLHSEAAKNWPNTALVNVDSPIKQGWVDLLVDLKYSVVTNVQVKTRRYGGLANADLRADRECLLVAVRGPNVG